MEAPQCRFQIYGISWGDANTAIAQAFLSLTYYGKSPAGSGGSSRKSRSPGAHWAFSLGEDETGRLRDIFPVSSSRPKWRDLYCRTLISMHTVIGK